MTFATPLDLWIAAFFALRSWGAGRTLLIALVVTPLYLWSLPPISCGCLRSPFRRCTTGPSHFAAMKSDLKNLASQQEIHYADHYAYSYDPSEIGFVSSTGVDVTIFASRDGWAAVARHEALGEEESCAIYYGAHPETGARLVGVGQPGEVVCTT